MLVDEWVFGKFRNNTAIMAMVQERVNPDIANIDALTPQLFYSIISCDQTYTLKNKISLQEFTIQFDYFAVPYVQLKTLQDLIRSEFEVSQDGTCDMCRLQTMQSIPEDNGVYHGQQSYTVLFRQG